MKRKYFVLILILIITLWLIGCAKTKLDTVKNPELSHIKFEKILIVAPFTDIGLRRQTENVFVSKFASADMTAVSSLELIPPIKEYTDQELLNILDQNRIDGILTVALKDFWTTKSYVPRSSSTHGSASLYGNSLYYRSYTQEYGGYYVSKPHVSFETRLFDRQSGQVAWLVSSTTSGNAFADYGNLANSLAKKIVAELKKEKMLVLNSTEIQEKSTLSKSEVPPTEKYINQLPIAKFVADPRTGEAPLEVFFDASESYDPDGRIETYQWDFKDGNKDAGKIVKHTFYSSGTYNVELAIIDNEGAKTTITRIIIVRS
ncbi:MAG TPA: hypothetical protein DEG96_05980 [Candidatus Atribacteria bacterium]|uniref:PKD domain-containing protein n=1 Tax=candidate division TA06 bacterium 34_109 TaxID=1635277 RepID=A0A101HZX1_UNCT6|nr:MAG: Uncharacterized protein XE03_1482 [candidate division TA06 bacterium 34_109]HBY57394.1 hypothetical protein [Candidatus Atribacteria bacterium]